MSDPLMISRSARESLARGLAALQTDPTLPSQMLSMAEPIAQAMGALHQVERSHGTDLVTHAATALGHVRGALAQLQQQPASHPAIASALEAVAASLGLVHQLSRTINSSVGSAPQAASPAPQAVAVTAPVVIAGPAPQQAPQPMIQQPAPPQPAAAQPAPQQPAAAAPVQPAAPATPHPPSAVPFVLASAAQIAPQPPPPAAPFALASAAQPAPQAPTQQTVRLNSTQPMPQSHGAIGVPRPGGAQAVAARNPANFGTLPLTPPMGPLVAPQAAPPVQPMQPAPIQPQALVFQAPMQQAPMQQAPMQQAPMQQAPMQQAPMQQPPMQQAPMQQAPMQQPPVQQAHAAPAQAYPPQVQPAGHAAPAALAQDPFAGRTAVADPFAAPQPDRPPAAPSAPTAPTAKQTINADLGAHSPTNFYKGLSGNDIVDHGGLFVATYMIPKKGIPVRLHVSLPGGYEFDADAVVRWVRKQTSGTDAMPGFGAQFTDISPEARQLIYRYVRNREPLFHDDM